MKDLLDEVQHACLDFRNDEVSDCHDSIRLIQSLNAGPLAVSMIATLNSSASRALWPKLFAACSQPLVGAETIARGMLVPQYECSDVTSKRVDQRARQSS
jgi:hypothetical protein